MQFAFLKFYHSAASASCERTVRVLTEMQSKR